MKLEKPWRKYDHAYGCERWMEYGKHGLTRIMYKNQLGNMFGQEFEYDENGKYVCSYVLTQNKEDKSMKREKL